MGAAISAAGIQAAQAMGAAIAAAGSGQATGNAIAGATGSAGSATSTGGGWTSWVGAAASLFFADGGHVRGAGTTTSDSIPIMASDYEFITRAAVVQQPGALPFLHDFNRRGMAVLDDWARGRIAHHATGGLAGIPAPAAPAPGLPTTRLAEPASGTTLQNSQNFYLVDDPQRIAEVAFGSRAGREAMFIAISREPAKFRSILGIN